MSVSLYDAIVQSCNVYFYELGARPGMMDRLAKFGADLGLGAPTGLGLNGEEGGFLPTEEWYREQKRQNPKAEGFQIGQALNAVIGQGSTRVTLLQMALLYAAIANGGKLWLPQIVERVESPDGQVLEEFAPRVRREISVSPETLAVVRQALVGVVNESQGDRLQGARSRTSRWRARPAPRRCRRRARRELGGYEARRPRLVRRLRAGRAAARSRSRCWSSTAATAATSRRRWRWRSSTTTSRRVAARRRRTRRTSGCAPARATARRPSEPRPPQRRARPTAPPRRPSEAAVTPWRRLAGASCASASTGR